MKDIDKRRIEKLGEEFTEWTLLIDDITPLRATLLNGAMDPGEYQGAMCEGLAAVLGHIRSVINQQQQNSTGRSETR